MSNSRFVIIDDMRRQRAIQAVQSAPIGSLVTIREGEARSLDQNARLWASLGDIASQVEWYGKKLTSENWKCMFSASLKKQQVVPGLDGGFVVLGQSTSRMSKREFSDLIELINAFGAEHSVRWSDYQEREAP
jgi:hypothetical protein